MMTLEQVSIVLNAKLIGENATFTSVGTDSRKLTAGQLFVALKGEKFDGHLYAERALKEGAAAVMVQADFAEDLTLSPVLVVDDTYQALGQLAAYWRDQFICPVMAVTGSNGKTTVKEMLASVLKANCLHGEEVLSTVGNLNNHIGMPLTLLNMTEDHAYAVVEMGMNHSGEIRYLTHIAKPNVVVINNAGNAHLGELGSYEAIAEAKGEIIEGVADDGTVVLNADDQFYPMWKALAGDKEVITFGLSKVSDVSASYQLYMSNSEMQIKTPLGSVTVSLPSPGLHNVMNALAATACAVAVGVSLQAIKRGLEGFVVAKGRLQNQVGLNGAVVIDDTYNANPSSMKAAVDVLKQYQGKTILVLGDMGELGTDEKAMHQEVGVYAKAAGIQSLYTLGILSKEITNAFGEGATHFSEIADLVTVLKKVMQQDVMVLVKGSRFMAMERVVHALTKQEENAKAEAH
jgi:UDP-N-acetylmuramoyl-tripeptide--D-alanyl-D-alanine ligase